MKVPFVDLHSQHLIIQQEIIKMWEEIVSNTDFILGKYVALFERQFADYCNTKYCIGVNSGTDALLLALKALGLGVGDEVITAANTFVATIEGIVHAGCSPVLVDVFPDTYNINYTKIEERISNRTKAIIPVHLYGQPADMEYIMELAKKYNLYVIEDASQAHGATYKERKVGTFGDVACFSFYPGKNLGAYGDAGAVVTNNIQIAEMLNKLRNHGGIEKYQHDIIGFNTRLDSLQAAVLLSKLKHIDNWNNKRIENACIYDKLLMKTDGIVTPGIINNVNHVYHLYVIRMLKGDRNQMIKYLMSKGIAVGIHYPKPIHRIEAYKKFTDKNLAVSEKVAQEIISLPMWPGLRNEQIEYVSEQINTFMEAEV